MMRFELIRPQRERQKRTSRKIKAKEMTHEINSTCHCTPNRSNPFRNQGDKIMDKNGPSMKTSTDQSLRDNLATEVRMLFIKGTPKKSFSNHILIDFKVRSRGRSAIISGDQ